MKQLIQNFKSGELKLEDLPAPQLQPGGVLVRTRWSLISAGTERTTVSTAQASLLGKARQRPDLVKQVLDTARKEGIAATMQKVKTRLETERPLGYSSAGVVIASSTPEYKPGDKVACAGAGANHTEMTFVTRNLTAQIPDGVSLDEAAFTTLGAIAMQGVRQADVRLGERVVVVGLGLLGLLTVGILRAAGCQVLGADINEHNFETARKLGAADARLMTDLEHASLQFTDGHGADAVIITASTKSNDPIKLAGTISRKKGVIVVVGAVGMDIPRDPDYYQKELDIRMSCSYGPGRYDVEYEETGQDYPYAYVRWTEQRNMEAFLQLLADKKLSLTPLITHRFPIDQALKAYDIVLGKEPEPHIGILLSYENNPVSQSVYTNPMADSASASLVVGFIGAGKFAQNALLPNVKGFPDTQLQTVATATGVSGKTAATKYGFRNFTTNSKQVVEDPDINTLFIATRHNLHAEWVLQGLQAGKHVFVEKPLTMTRDELDAVSDQLRAPDNQGLLMVGYNRRFAPLVNTMRVFLQEPGAPMSLTYRISAGFIPSDSWIQNPAIGGGRIIGEVCHFVDLLRSLVGEPVESIFAQALPDKGIYNRDNLHATLTYRDGSVGTIVYLANGNKGVDKEYLEAHVAGHSAVLHDFHRLDLFGDQRKITKEKMDKGHAAEVKAFLSAIQNRKPAPIPPTELLEVSHTVFAILDSLEQGVPIRL